MTRENAISATGVAIIAVFGLIIWVLTYVPWLLRWRGQEYLAASSALSAAVAALFTLAAAIVGAVYVVLTYFLWRQQHAAGQAVLMQQLMVEYDGLRGSIRTVQDWFN